MTTNCKISQSESLNHTAGEHEELVLTGVIGRLDPIESEDLRIVKDKSACATDSAIQRHANNVIRIISSGIEDMESAIIEHTLNFPDNEGTIKVYKVDPSDPKQLEELQQLLSLLQKAEIVTGDGNIEIVLPGYVNSSETPRYRYSITKEILDNEFVTATLEVMQEFGGDLEVKPGEKIKHNIAKKLLTFNIEINEALDKTSGNVIFKIDCHCNERGIALPIYTNRLKGNDLAFDCSLLILLYCSSKIQAYKTLRQMITKGFFDADLEMIFSS